MAREKEAPPPTARPFLQIITRTFGQRPTLLARCRESVALLCDADYVQTVIADDGGRGVAWANRNLSTVEAQGEWVWVLDDDDLCSDRELIARLRRVAAHQEPDVILVRVFHGKWGLLPPDVRWGTRPVCGQYGGACAVVRRDVWDVHRAGWESIYAADFWFVNRLWDAGLRFAWLDVIAGYQPQQNNGAGDDAR